MTFHWKQQSLTLVGVIVYNRIENVKHWVRCWPQCLCLDYAKLLIIKNQDGVTDDECQAICDAAGIQCIQRPNIGYDTGAFQDIVRGRISSDYAWSNILWATDDTIPMRRDFWLHMRNVLHQDNVGLSACHLSWEYVRHCRTTGYMLRREVAERLQFPADPVLTKDQCYDFEHRVNTMYNQVQDMGYLVRQAADTFDHLMWDTDHYRHLAGNWDRHYAQFR